MPTPNAFLRGIVFSILVLLSSTFGAIFLLAPFLPLVHVSPRLARYVVDGIVLSWKMYVVALYEIMLGVKIVIKGEPGKLDDRSLIILNHRTRLDWLFAFSYQLRFGSLKHMNIVLKSDLKKVPGPGWAMQWMVLIFLDRVWRTDQTLLTEYLDYFISLKYPLQLLLFPEGQDFSPYAKRKSDEYARSHDLQPYEHILHPKTTGFVHIVKQLHNHNMLDAVWDLTVVYPQNTVHSELELLCGHFPREVLFFTKAHPVESMKTSEEGLRDWCKEAWKRKELLLKSNCEHWAPTINTPQMESSIKRLLSFYLILWSLLLCIMLFSLYRYIVVQLYFLLIPMIYPCIYLYYGGIDIMQIRSIKS